MINLEVKRVEIQCRRYDYPHKETVYAYFVCGRWLSNGCESQCGLEACRQCGKAVEELLNRPPAPYS